MGPNGSGKSTLANVIMGNPAYQVKSQKSKVKINKQDIIELEPEERAKAGVFLAFQAPIAIPGVTVINLLRTAYQELFAQETDSDTTVQNPVLQRRWKAAGKTLQEFTAMVKQYCTELHIDQAFLQRGIHDGFSGGEKKKLEMLQALVLSPKFALFDEIDTGLDVDALKIVAKGIQMLSEQGTGVIIITHYQRILSHIKPDYVHILVQGKLVTSGGSELAKQIESEGYKAYENTITN
jgi:Fe-S cluster assembly ATP-binding protein